MSTNSFPVFGGNGEEGDLGPELRCGLPVFKPHFQGDLTEESDRKFLEISFALYPELTAAHLKLERCRAVAKHYAQLASEIADRVLAATSVAQRANQSLLHEDFLHPQRIDDPAPLPGPNNRLAAVLEEQRECREELCAAIEELDQAEKVHAVLLEKSGQLL